MTRYFYTDPLAAAWMEKHHGFKICVQRVSGFDSGPGGHKSRVYPNEIIELAKSRPDYQNYMVDESSLHLLEPVEGDLFKNSWGNSTYFRGRLSDDDFVQEIIQRNGIPFHWPEVSHE